MATARIDSDDTSESRDGQDQINVGARILVTRHGGIFLGAAAFLEALMLWEREILDRQREGGCGRDDGFWQKADQLRTWVAIVWVC